jgi:outer membrane protein assembly factor BamB
LKSKLFNHPPRRLLFGVLLLILLFASACTGSTSSWPGIVSQSDNAVIITYRHTVVSLNADKSRNWTYKGDDEADFFAPAFIDEENSRVYVGDYKGRVHAISLEDGSGIWRYEPERTSLFGVSFGESDRILAPIALGDGKLFYGNEHGIVALNISGDSPSVDWSFDTHHSVWGQPLYIDEQHVDVAIEPTLFVTSLDQHVYALNPQDGSERWSIDLDGGIPGGITFIDGAQPRLYIGTMNSELIVLNLDGEVLDRFETEGWIWGPPVLYEGALYFSDLSGYLYQVGLTEDGLFDDENSHHRNLTEKPLRATPLIVEDENGDPVIVIGSEDKRIYAVDLTWIPNEGGGVRWSRHVDTKVVSDLSWVDRQTEDEEPKRLVIIGTEDNDRIVLALRLNDEGREEWSYKYED